MSQFSSIIRSITPEKFIEILSASGRQAREVYFHRHDIRAPKSKGLPKAGAKNEYRMAQLFVSLSQNDDEELAEEVLRTWLLTKRPILIAALDHLKIAHKGGLTESDDVSRIEKLNATELTDLRAALLQVASEEDVQLYLQFMGVKNPQGSAGAQTA